MIAEISVDHLEFFVVEALFGLRIEIGSEGVSGCSSTEQPSDEFDHDGDYNGDCRNNAIIRSN